MEKHGALMLAPVYELLFGKGEYWSSESSLVLNEYQITISYKTYKSDHADDMLAIKNAKLTPGTNDQYNV